MSSPGLATMSRGDFLAALGITQAVKDALKAQKKTTRNIFEQSTATTQCGNTIGPCVLGTDCYLCGAPIYLNNDGSEWGRDQYDAYIASGTAGARDDWVEKNTQIDKHILPQCEHILPVMQAFLILGGLYWTKTFADLPLEQQNILRKYEYAWSHAHCNIIKSDKNLFKDLGGGGGGGGATELLDTNMVNGLLRSVWKDIPSIRGWWVQKKTKEGWMRTQRDAITKKIEPLVNEYKRIMTNPLLFFASVIAPIYHMEILLPEHGMNIAKIMRIDSAPAPPMPRGWKKKSGSMIDAPPPSTRATDLSLASGSLLGGDILTNMLKDNAALKNCVTWLGNLFGLGPSDTSPRGIQKYAYRFQRGDENIKGGIEIALQTLYTVLLPHDENDREMIQEFIMSKSEVEVAAQQIYMTHLWQAIVLVNFLRRSNNTDLGSCDHARQYNESKAAILKTLMVYFQNNELKIPLNTTLSLVTKNWNVSDGKEGSDVEADNLAIVNTAMPGSGAAIGKQSAFDEYVKERTTRLEQSKKARQRWSRARRDVLAAVRLKRNPLVKIETYATIINSMRKESVGEWQSEKERKTVQKEEEKEEEEREVGGEVTPQDVEEIIDIAVATRQNLIHLTADDGDAGAGNRKRKYEGELKIYTKNAIDVAIKEFDDTSTDDAGGSAAPSPAAASLTTAAPAATSLTTAAPRTATSQPLSFREIAAAKALDSLKLGKSGIGGGGRKGLSKSGKKPKKNHQRKKTRKKHRQKRTRKTKKMPKKKTVKLIHFYNNRNKQNKSKKK